MWLCLHIWGAEPCPKEGSQALGLLTVRGWRERGTPLSKTL